MKKRCYLLACLGMLLCTLLAPVTSVGAAVTWPTTSGYPAPPSFGDVDGLFSPTMGDSSLLTDPTGGCRSGLRLTRIKQIGREQFQTRHQCSIWIRIVGLRSLFRQ